MPSPNKNKIAGIIGTKGTGKSSLAETIFKRRPRAVVFDTMGEYDYGFCVSERRAFLSYLRKNEDFRVCYLPLEEEDFSFVSKAVRLKGGLLFIVEEISQYCSANATDPEFAKCIQLGRHANLDILYTGQRFADISRRITSQTDVFYFFRVSEPRDLEAISARFGNEIAEKVSSLPNLSYVRIEVGKVDQNVQQNVVRVGNRGVPRGMVYRGETAGPGREGHSAEIPG